MGQIYWHILYFWRQYWMEQQHPLTSHLPLINMAPWPIILIMITYLLLVLKMIPSFMAKRKPFQLQKPILFYNIFMFVINGYFFFQFISRINYWKKFFNFKYRVIEEETSPEINKLIHLGMKFVIPNQAINFQ